MPLSGPVEFSTADIVVMLILAALFFLIPLAIGAVIGIVVYRWRTPVEARDRSGHWRAAVLGIVVGTVIVFAFGMLQAMLAGI